MQQRFIIEYRKSFHLNKWVALFYISCFIFGCSETQILSPRFKGDPPPNVSQSTVKKLPKRPPSPNINPISILIPVDMDSKYPMGSGVGFVNPSEKETFSEKDGVSFGRGLSGEDSASLSGGNVTFAVPSTEHGFSGRNLVSVGSRSDNKGSSFLLGGEVTFAIPSSDRGFSAEDTVSIGSGLRDKSSLFLQGEVVQVAVLSEGGGFTGEGLVPVGRKLSDKGSSSFSVDRNVSFSGETMPFVVLSKQGEFPEGGLASAGRGLSDEGSSFSQGEVVQVAVLSEGGGFTGEGLVPVREKLSGKGSLSFSVDENVSFSGETMPFVVSSEQGEFPEGGLASVGRGLSGEGSSFSQGEVVQVAVLSEGGGFTGADLVSGGKKLRDKGSLSFSVDRNVSFSGETMPFVVSSEQGEFPEGSLASVGRGLSDEGSSFSEGEEVRVAVLSEGGGFTGADLISVGKKLRDKGSLSFSVDENVSFSGESIPFVVSSEQGEFPEGSLASVGRGLSDEGSSFSEGEEIRVAVLSKWQEFSEEEGGAFPFGHSTERESVFVDENMAFSVSVEEGEKFIDGEAGTFTNGQWANEEQVLLEGSAVTFSIQVAETSFPEGKVVSFINYESALKTVFFAVDSSELSHDTQKALDQNIRWLRNYPDVRVVLEGHCDPQGSEAYNIKLGQSRAERVKQYLVEQGISEKRLGLISYGEANLLSYEDDAKNRRVSFLIDPETHKEQE